MASFNPAFVTHTMPSGRHSTQNVMQNQAIPGSLARSIHYTAENFPFSVSLLTELTKSGKNLSRGQSRPVVGASNSPAPLSHHLLQWDTL